MEQTRPLKPSAAGWQPRRAAALTVAAGLGLGGAHLHPAAAPLAWLGFTLFAGCLTYAPSWRSRVLIALGASWLCLFVSQIWLCLCIANYMGPVIGQDSAPMWLSTLTWGLATTIETTRRGLPLALAAALLGGRWPTRWWLPPAFLAGEALGGHLGFMMGDLLHAQWRAAPILRSVALVGVTATAALGCYAAAALGEAVAKGGARWGMGLALPVFAWFAALPPIPAADDALVGVAAVHMSDGAHPPSPRALAPDVELLVWPEAAFRAPMAATEGQPPSPPKLDGLRTWEGLHHVVNVTASSPEGALNAIGVTDIHAAVTALRGKAALTPWGEVAWGGLDPMGSPFLTGQAPPTLDVAGWRLVATICYEVYAGGLFREGAARGGELLVNIANDRAYGPSTLGIRQAIGVLALRAAEAHRPAVRASLWGSAAVLSSTGELLALSEPNTTGILRWDGLPGRPAFATVVLSDAQMPTPFRCAAPGCVDIPLASSRCDARAPTAEAVVVSGHSLPPMYLGATPRALAQAIACLRPTLIVLDTCYGFSSPLLLALVREGVDARVVGSRKQVPGAGLNYGEAFFSGAGAKARGDGVLWGTDALESWRIDGEELDAALALVERWPPEELTGRLQRVHPNLVNAPLAGSGATALVWVPPERFRRGGDAPAPSGR